MSISLLTIAIAVVSQQTRCIGATKVRHLRSASSEPPVAFPTPTDAQITTSSTVFRPPVLGETDNSQTTAHISPPFTDADSPPQELPPDPSSLVSHHHYVRRLAGTILSLGAEDLIQLSDASTPQFGDWSAMRLERYGDTCVTEELPISENTELGYIRFNAGVQCSGKSSVMLNDVMTRSQFDLSGGYEVDFFVLGAGRWCCCFSHSVATTASFLNRLGFSDCCLSVHHVYNGSKNIGDGVVTTFAVTFGPELYDGTCEYTATTYRNHDGYIWQRRSGVVPVCRDLRAVNLAFHFGDCYKKTAASMQISSDIRVGEPQAFVDVAEPSALPSSNPTTEMPTLDPTAHASALPSMSPSFVPTTEMPTPRPTVPLSGSVQPSANASERDNSSVLVSLSLHDVIYVVVICLLLLGMVVCGCALCWVVRRRGDDIVATANIYGSSTAMF